MGVLPLGTGNDLARVLGWGCSCDDDAHLPQLLDKYERGTSKMLDRWSVMSFERGVVLEPPAAVKLAGSPTELCVEATAVHDFQYQEEIAALEQNVATHLHRIITSQDHCNVIQSVK